MLVRHTGKKAKEIAKLLQPEIHQHVEGMFDMISPLHLSGGNDEYVKMATSMKKPPLHYIVHEDDDYVYCYYWIYHAYDWSDRNLPCFIKKVVDKMDSHRHDTEGVLVRAKKRKLRGGYGRKDVCTVWPYTFRFENKVGI